MFWQATNLCALSIIETLKSIVNWGGKSLDTGLLIFTKRTFPETGKINSSRQFTGSWSLSPLVMMGLSPTKFQIFSSPMYKNLQFFNLSAQFL